MNTIEKCGACGYFDPLNVERNPWGSKQIQGEDGKTREIKQGVCRAERGLVLGVLDENTICKQPPGTFIPKDEIALIS